MSDEKWVTLTPEQAEALDQGAIVRAHRGDTTVQGPIEGLVGEDEPDVWVSEIRVKSPDWIEARERDVPKPDAVDPTLRPGDRVRLVDLDGREFHRTIGPGLEPDPQRLVSVRADDLEELYKAWDDGRRINSGVHDRIRAALRGETS